MKWPSQLPSSRMSIPGTLLLVGGLLLLALTTPAAASESSQLSVERQVWPIEKLHTSLSFRHDTLNLSLIHI